MLTVSQVARIANVAPNTVRNYAREFPDLFSEAANPLQGNRQFDETDVETICSLVALKASGMPLAQAAQRLRSQEAPPVIDVAANSPANAQQALQATQMPLVALSSLQARLEAVERTQRLLLRVAVLWGALWGAVTALAFGGFVLWVFYLWGG